MGCRLATFGQLADLSQALAESFPGFFPSGPQAFAGSWGTIQTGSTTGLYVSDSNDGPVGDVDQSFPGPSADSGERKVDKFFLREPGCPHLGV